MTTVITKPARPTLMVVPKLFQAPKPQGSPPTQDTVTVLQALTGFAAKRITRFPDGQTKIKGYSAGSTFRASVHRVHDIASLSKLLLAIERKPDCLVIRGHPREGVDLSRVVLRRKDFFETPEKGRRWVMIDFDKIPLASGVLTPRTMVSAADHLISLLPSEFHNATYHLQLSSSAGFTDPMALSLHVWFWLDRPLTDKALKHWARPLNETAGLKLIDTAPFNDVQPHYTAAPFIEGTADPFPVRSGLVRKKVGAVPIVVPLQSVKRQPPQASGLVQGVSGSDRFNAALAEIGDHPGGLGFHEPILRATAVYAATRRPEEVDVEALYELIRARVLSADRSHHSDDEVENRASREHIIPAIEGAIRKFSGQATLKPRRVEGLQPHYAAKSMTTKEVAKELGSAIDDFFK